MSKKYQSVRGTKDKLPKDTYKWQYIERVIRDVVTSYGYAEIRIPTFEETSLFKRSVGETTDVVQKEMYSFKMGEEDLTLRPEGTAGTVRAVLEHGLLNDAHPLKLFYMLSCFRYERPQAGRYREFHQFGIESFGSKGPIEDAEVISLVKNLLDRLGITGIELHINSIGCPDCRPAYNNKLKDYYAKYKDHLCENCINRFDNNPLRLLDCKEEQCQPFKSDAPKILENLCETCQKHFDEFRESLDIMNIEYKIDSGIVRGLDYYTKTVFEFVTNTIGAQGTVCGGGRYDGLVEELGGPTTPALGFGMGMERLILTMEACDAEFPPEPESIIYIGSMGEKESKMALSLSCKLREDGFFVLCDTIGRSVRAQMKYANKKNAKFSCIIGGNELESGEMEINNMQTGDKKNVKIDYKSVSDFLYSQIESDILTELD